MNKTPLPFIVEGVLMPHFLNISRNTTIVWCQSTQFHFIVSHSQPQGIESGNLLLFPPSSSIFRLTANKNTYLCSITKIKKDFFPLFNASSFDGMVCCVMAVYNSPLCCITVFLMLNKLYLYFSSGVNIIYHNTLSERKKRDALYTAKCENCLDEFCLFSSFFFL